MKVFTVSFFGHRMIDNVLKIESRLEQLIRTLLREHEYIEFLVGRDGEFDQLVSSAIRRCKREYRSDNSAHIWMLPYITAEFRDNEESFRDYYDEIEVCEAAAGSHFKAAFQARNRAMVNRSHLVVFCIDHHSGGAWQTFQYAQQQGIPYINLHTAALEELERSMYYLPSAVPWLRSWHWSVLLILRIVRKLPTMNTSTMYLLSSRRIATSVVTGPIR